MSLLSCKALRVLSAPQTEGNSFPKAVVRHSLHSFHTLLCCQYSGYHLPALTHNSPPPVTYRVLGWSSATPLCCRTSGAAEHSGEQQLPVGWPSTTGATLAWCRRGTGSTHGACTDQDRGLCSEQLGLTLNFRHPKHRGAAHMLIVWSGIKIPISHYLSSCEWMVEDMVCGMDFLWASKVFLGDHSEGQKLYRHV